MTPNDTPPRPCGLWQIARPLCVLVVLWSAGVGYLWSRWQRAEARPIVQLEGRGEWITSPDAQAYSGYFRTVIYLPSRVKHAWVAIAPDNAFELTVNGSPAGHFYLWRPTRPYQTGLSDPGQRLVSQLPALGLNWPREYQWTDHDNARLPVWLDIGNNLRPGKNVLCVQVEARHCAPGFRLEGAIELWSGEVLPIASNRTWRAEPVPPNVGRPDWAHPNYFDGHWRTAALSQREHSAPQCAFDRRLFQRAFAGHTVNAPSGGTNAAVWFRGTWDVPGPVTEACLRVLTNRPFEVFLNGRRLGPATPSPLNLDSGNWSISDRNFGDDFRRPEIVDPDEIGSLFVGKAFLSPRHADPTFDPIVTYRNQINVTTDAPSATSRSDLPGTYDPKRDLEETRRTPTKPEGFLDNLIPLRSLERDRGVFTYYGYDVTALLRPGKNLIEVRTAESATVAPPNWAPQIAVDGLATTANGAELLFQTDDSWVCSVSGGRQSDADWSLVQDVGPALMWKAPLPPLIYRGIQTSPSDDFRLWLTVALFVAAATLGFLLLGRPMASVRWAPFWATALMLATALIGCTVLLQVSYAEREEALWSLQSWPWQATLAAVAGTLVLSGAYFLVRSCRGGDVAASALPVPRRWSLLSSKPVWDLAVVAVLLGATFLRVYKLDIQPIDDDEYASVQGVIAIARTGVPGFVAEGVYYSRSPAYHYLTAAVVAVFGENIWALRLPSVFFGVATLWLTYLMGALFFRSRAVGFGAMVLMALHPLAIFTAHVARFYQQQQFFALLTVYWFCKGFVTGQRQGYRYLTVIGFLVTVCSQEIAIAMGPVFLIAFLLFAKDLGWKQNVRLALACAVALGYIFLDWAAFQTLCLTRMEGLSPNFEATVKPHFWSPFHLFSMFIGYSRLHFSLSLFILGDLFLGWRSRGRCALAIFVLLVVGVLMVNLLVTHTGLRYMYFLFPLWALLGVEAIRRVAVRLAGLFSFAALRAPNALAATLGVLFFCTVVLSWSPWRTLGSYELKLLPDSTGACRYVAGQLRPGDKVMMTEPHPHAAFLEIGQSDYDLAVPVLMDFVVLQRGALIDRNAGTESVGGLAQLRQVLMANDRVWILINKEKFRTRGKNIGWEYPAARVEEYLRHNAELKYQSPFWYVYLWDASVGNLHNFAAD